MPSLSGLYRIPLWREARLGVDAAELVRSPVWRGVDVPRGQRQPVLLIPGLMAGDESLAVLARWLHRHNYMPVKAGIRSNIDCSERAITRLEALLVDIAADYGMKVLVIGHSRGGLMGRVLAVRRPDLVAGLVTLGSPHLGGLDDIHPLLKSTVEGFATLGTRGINGVFSHTCKPVPGGCCERFWVDLDGAFPEDVPFLSVYSRTDGVVGWRSCLDPAARHAHVKSTHMGMGWNRHVFTAVAAELGVLQQADAWKLSKRRARTAA